MNPDLQPDNMTKWKIPAIIAGVLLLIGADALYSD